MIHFRNSLLSDKFASGPFLSYLQKFSDQEGQLCLRFWMQLEMLRLNFQSYHQRYVHFRSHFRYYPGFRGLPGYQGLNLIVKRLLKFLFVLLPGPLPVVLSVHDPLLLSDLLGSMNSILVTCKYHTHLIPGVFELLNDIERLDILRLMTFPWQFRYIQKLCMEELYIKWCDFILTGINGYLKIPDKSQTFLVCLRLNSE